VPVDALDTDSLDTDWVDTDSLDTDSLDTDWVDADLRVGAGIGCNWTGMPLRTAVPAS